MSNVNQQLSLIPLGQLNAALVQTGYGSEVSSNKPEVVSILSRIVDNGGIDVDSIRKLVPLSTTAINAKQASQAPKVSASAGKVDSLAIQSAIEAVDETKVQVVAIAQTARDFIKQAETERQALLDSLDTLGNDVVERLNKEVAKVQGVDYDIVNAAARDEVNKLFESFRSTVTPEQLEVIANAVPVFELKTAGDVFPAPLHYQYHGETIDFSNFPVGVWNDPDAPTLVDDYIFNPQHLHQALVALNDPLPDNVWLAGERGTGKTEFVNQIASRLGRKLYRINFDEAMERAEFIGGNTIKNGDVEWKAGVITQAIQHTGALVLLDEIGFARAQNLAALHALCERSAHRSIVIAETGVRIPVASHVAFFCADNSNGHGDASGNFAGVRDQNTAFIDRFSFTLNFEYLPFADEVDLVVNRTSLNRDAAEVLIGFANVAREKARAGVLTQPPSLRQLFAWARAVKRGLPVGIAFDNAIVNKFPADCESELRGVFSATVDVTQLKNYLAK
jgi:nitric oxide reductase NorQ protein